MPLTGPSEYLPATGQDLVQSFLEVGGGLSDLFAYLLGVLLPALLDLLLEELLEIAVPEAFLPLAWVVHHHVGNERAGQPARLEGRIL
jgi:hypothetical protein